MALYIYVGTYTHISEQEHRKEGIFLFRVNTEDGKLEPIRSFEAGRNPSFLAMHSGKKYLYAVNEAGDGSASAYAVDTNNGGLTRLNEQETHGRSPCYLSFDPSGRYILVANYSGGNLTVFPIETDGRLGPASDVVQHAGARDGEDLTPHAHSIRFDPTGKYVLAADLGLDKVFVYQLKDGHLVAHDPTGADLKPGAGPRHFDFHPNGRFLYVANELDSTVTACVWDANTGKISPFQTLSTLPEDFQGKNSVADIHIAPSGKHVYVSNRGHDSLAHFSIDQTSGNLRLVDHSSTGGAFPRNFAIYPGGRYIAVANQQSDNLVIFAVDARSGNLKPTGEVHHLPRPVCVLFVEM